MLPPQLSKPQKYGAKVMRQKYFFLQLSIIIYDWLEQKREKMMDVHVCSEKQNFCYDL